MEFNRRKLFIYLQCLKLKRSNRIQHQEINRTRLQTTAKLHAAKGFLAAVAAGAAAVANRKLTPSTRKSDRKVAPQPVNRIALFV